MMPPWYYRMIPARILGCVVLEIRDVTWTDDKKLHSFLLSLLLSRRGCFPRGLWLAIRWALKINIHLLVSNEDCSPAKIHGCDAAPTPTGFAQIVSDYFPVLHCSRLRIVARAIRVFPAFDTAMMWTSSASDCATLWAVIVYRSDSVALLTGNGCRLIR